MRVSQPGDFSTYSLRIADAALDPAYSAVDFSFKAGCPSRFDCRPRAECPPEPRAEPPIDYMARDYASFRQALIDLIPTLAPGWIERNPACCISRATRFSPTATPRPSLSSLNTRGEP